MTFCHSVATSTFYQALRNLVLEVSRRLTINNGTTTCIYYIHKIRIDTTSAGMAQWGQKYTWRQDKNTAIYFSPLLADYKDEIEPWVTQWYTVPIDSFELTSTRHTTPTSYVWYTIRVHSFGISPALLA
ncbi:hypothetical protein OPQ81_009974 [Rhizoctonia solani]|nr:hypothetical protein OPQ81_009974 [Rhizoctonia solani]